MRPYQNIKLEEFPDVADIQEGGRKSSVGCLQNKSGLYRSSIKSNKKKSTRRSLKRSDKQKVKFDEESTHED